MRALSNAQSTTRLLSSLLLLVSSWACAVTPTAERVADAGFADIGAAGTLPADAGNGLGSGCALYGACEPGVSCCPENTPRCVPGISGANRCVADGTLAPGTRCGQDGVDNCSAGALCSSDDTEQLLCRVLCLDDDDCQGSSCTAAVTIGGQIVRFCDESSANQPN